MVSVARQVHWQRKRRAVRCIAQETVLLLDRTGRATYTREREIERDIEMGTHRDRSINQSINVVIYHTVVLSLVNTRSSGSASITCPRSISSR